MDIAKTATARVLNEFTDKGDEAKTDKDGWNQLATCALVDRLIKRM
jgi:hypothetical protein